MDDLPLFLQMFVRFFAALSFAAGLFFAAPRQEPKRAEREKEPVVKPAGKQHAPEAVCPGAAPGNPLKK